MIGIIMLDTQFPRVHGDIGNPSSFRHPVIYEVVDKAHVDKIITNQPFNDEQVRQFIHAARKLERDGAKVIGTSCGFLSQLQSTLQSAVSVPVLTSALSLLPVLRVVYGQRAKFGILSFDQQKLSSMHFNGEPVDKLYVQGLPSGGELVKCISEDKTSLNSEKALRDVMESASKILAKQPKIDVFLLECTNISPYKQQLRAEFKRPVYDLVDALQWIASASLDTE